MLELKDLSKSFGSKQVLNRINLQFSPGKVYGIVGKNGAGKTTLFRCIAGLESYTGSINTPHEPLKNHLGYLETDPVFLSYITGWEYLKLMCVSKGIATENFEAQNIFELPLKQYAETYSTGMKKKLALMGLLLRKNEILVLDEPFNGVDIQSNMLITDIIHRLKALGKTVIISSHIFSTLRDTCDEIALLSKGKIVEQVGRQGFDRLERQLKSAANQSLEKKLNL